MKSRTVMITGASSGFGSHFARVMASAGAPAVVLAARRVDKLKELATSLAREVPACRVVTVPMDVANVASIRAAFHDAEKQLQGATITCLINNAGIAKPQLSLQTEEADWDEVMNTNLRGAFFVAQEACRRMVKAKAPSGVVVNVASIVGLRASSRQANYGASKAGLLHLNRIMASELSRHGIRCNALCPGYFGTEMNDEFFETPPGKAYLKKIPPGRLGNMSELNGPLLLLASEASSFMTGTHITVDLGHTNAAL